MLKIDDAKTAVSPTIDGMIKALTKAMEAIFLIFILFPFFYLLYILCAFM